MEALTTDWLSESGARSCASNAQYAPALFLGPCGRVPPATAVCPLMCAGVREQRSSTSQHADRAPSGIAALDRIAASSPGQAKDSIRLSIACYTAYSVQRWLDYVNYDRMLLVQWLFQTLITPLLRDRRDLHIRCMARWSLWPRCWRRRNQLVYQADSEGSRRPRSQSHRLEHHAGCRMTRPTRTLGTTPHIFGPLRRPSRQFSPRHDRANLARGDFVTVTH